MMERMGRCADPSASTTGRRSRRERTVPVLYLDDGGRFVIVASLAARRGIQLGFLISRRIRGKAAGAKPALRCHCSARKRRGKGAALAAPLCHVPGL